MRVYYEGIFGKRKGMEIRFHPEGNPVFRSRFKTKTEARQAEAKRREEINNPISKLETPTDMDFLELVNSCLDYIKAYNSERHYTDHTYTFFRKSLTSTKKPITV